MHTDELNAAVDELKRLFPETIGNVYLLDADLRENAKTYGLKKALIQHVKNLRDMADQLEEVLNTLGPVEFRGQV